MYDGLGRRRVTKEYSWQANGWVKTNETRYVCDGYLPIQERDASGNVLVTYTRGLDLSGTFGGAGGIGGLLARTDGNGSAFYHSDAGGNVTCLTDASGNAVARYLNDPFGRPLGMWGPLAPVNRVQSSSMLTDQSGIVHFYGRDYNPVLQRFLNEDPIGEAGGINLYRFVGNNPISRVDPYGLLDYFYSGGGLLYPSGPVPYLEADTVLGQFGAGIYNTIPVAYNFLFGGLLNIGTAEGTINGQGGGPIAR